MPKILITGNGFDLSFGLPTAYSDFMNICKKLQTCSEFNWEDLKEDIIALRNAEKLPSTSFKDFESFKKRLNESTWFKYLSREYIINTWIDFEKHIGKALETILYHINTIRTETFQTTGKYSKNTDVFYKEEFGQKNFEAYLTFIDFKIFHIIDGFAPMLSSTFLKSVDDYYVDFEKNRLFTTILDDLNEFREIFAEYLRNIVRPLYEIVKNDDRSLLLKDITHHFTFNYTATFNNLVSSSPLTTFIHGALGINNNIVLGINEWENIGADGYNLIPFTKYFQKLNFGIDLKFVNEIQSDDNLYQFFFWGHSLDKSDAIYINEVFDRVDQLQEEHSQGKIIIIHHSESSRFNIIKNLIEIRGSKDIMNKQREGKLSFLQSGSELLQQELVLKITKKLSPTELHAYFR